MELTGAIREAKKGTAELVVLAFLEDQPRHGYELTQLIECTIRRCADVQLRLALRHVVQARRTEVDPGPLGRKVRATAAALLLDYHSRPRRARRAAQRVAAVLRVDSRSRGSDVCVTAACVNGARWCASGPIATGASCRPTSSTSSPVTSPTSTPRRAATARARKTHGAWRSTF